jgi:hypothetical protein
MTKQELRTPCSRRAWVVTNCDQLIEAGNRMERHVQKLAVKR